MRTPTTTLVVQIPALLYDRLKQRAEQTKRSVEDELVEAVAEALPASEEPLGSELSAAMAVLAAADDHALWQIVRHAFGADTVHELEALHLKRQDTGLSEAEAQTAAALTQQYEHAMLLRAQAIALLTQRGYDVAIFDTTV